MLEQGELAGVCMVDMSAAFDFVDTDLLLEKLKLYGFTSNATQWAWSYPRDLFLDPYSTLFSPMNSHKMCMKRAVLWELLKMPVSSQCSVWSAVGYAAMQMPAPTLCTTSWLTSSHQIS